MDGQLKRGLLDVCVLAAIKSEDSYGYKIIKDMMPYIELLDLGNTLHIFKDFGDQPLIGIELAPGKRLFRALHGGIDGEEQEQSREGDESHAPVKDEHHNGDDARGEKAARRDHDNTGGDVCHVLHGVGGDARCSAHGETPLI